MTAAKLGVGVIGLGVGEQHVRAFAAHPSCEIVALCDRNSDKLATVSAAHAQAKAFADAEELIRDPAVQIVSIASNDDDHAAQILQALRLRKHVFAEKPLCLDLETLHEIAAAWREARGARLTTNTVLRRSPRLRWLKTAIANGELGKVFCIEGDYVYGRLHKLTSGWRNEIRDYSVMLGGGVHIVDLVLWMAEQRPVEVTAYGSSLGSAGSGFHGTDLVLALLRFESGLIAKVGANFASVYSHFHRFVVHGTRGTFENLPAQISDSARLWTERDGGAPPTAVDAPYPAVGKGDLVPAFVASVLDKGEPDVSEEQAFACVATCLAIDRSVAEKRTVTVDYGQF